MADPTEDWSFGQAIGWAAGGAVGCGVGAGTLDFVNAIGDFSLILFVTSLSAMYGAIGGLIGGVVGYALAHFFHDAWSGWRMSTSFLFGLFLSLLIFAVLTFPVAVHVPGLLMHERLMIVSGFIAAVSAGGLGGIVNMLRAHRPVV
jgi:MFS family permease